MRRPTEKKEGGPSPSATAGPRPTGRASDCGCSETPTTVAGNTQRLVKGGGVSVWYGAAASIHFVIVS